MNPLGQRVLVLPPTRRDGEVTLALLAQAGLDGVVCATPALLCEHMAQGAGVVMLTEAALCDPAIEQLVAALALQPPWSDMPVVVLARDRQPPLVVARVLERLGNVTLLDRPVSARSMLSAVRSALRARERQYQIRDHLLLQERAEITLREGDRRKDEFLATLAHELRNPLAPLRNGLSVLKALALPSPDPRFAGVLGMMERQMGLLVRLVDDLLDVARISRGKIDLVRQPLELREVVDAALEGCAPLIRAARHEVEVHLAPQPVWVEADRARLVQVLGNLIGNAAKYTPDGGRITVELRLRGGSAELSVADTGVGIAPEMLTRVFDMYVQLQDGASRAQGGLGLGLSLVRRLVEMHGGTVAAHSPGPGAGSTFVVALPLLSTPAPQAPAACNSGPPKPANTLRVLVIDDNADAADALCMCLQAMGHTACARYSGSAGLQAAQALRPDVVFCDIGLPDIDGREVAARLRRDPAHCGVTLVALTGWGAAKDRQLSSSAGFDAHLTKPASMEDIGQVLGSRS
ncbi:hybrid sensor histidine kinase/response regulator [uncultured Azohydromonas sp.]|jgi:Signal transduction histidine kinase|uniref:hybrid sensor histidine kinase/response regulator n=1 Tax=uncultured Azohydromonas sp. TaxID=487342 RepID=UPI0026384E92|nr:hybrid sensor histidine kinase/response regulator [uncultured Azohydromonas sp.]